MGFLYLHVHAGDQLSTRILKPEPSRSSDKRLTVMVFLQPSDLVRHLTIFLLNNLGEEGEDFSAHSTFGPSCRSRNLRLCYGLSNACGLNLHA